MRDERMKVGAIPELGPWLYRWMTILIGIISQLDYTHILYNYIDIWWYMYISTLAIIWIYWDCISTTSLPFIYTIYACYCMFTISTSRNSWASMEPLSASHAFRRYVAAAASISCREADPNAMTLGLCLDIEMQRWQCIYLLCIYLSFVPVYTGNLVQTSQPPYITAL